MRKIDWKQKRQNLWLSLTIRKKICFFTGAAFLIIFLSALFNIWIVNFSINDLGIILEDNARNSEFMDAIEAESSCFKAYIKSPSEEMKNKLITACHRTSQAVSRLPYDYEKIGEDRYAATWSINNTYGVYQQKRDLILKMGEENPSYIKELYKVYSMQGFLQEYGKALMTCTLKEGTADYTQKAPRLKSIPFAFLFLGICLLAGIISLAQLMNKTIILPVMKLASMSRRLAANDFEVGDIKVKNKDEVGELVEAFNKMKAEIRQYIEAVEEKRKMAELLHKEEVEKLEVVRQLEAAKLEVVRNQIRPHFLFNTLNVIGGMAKLEEAKITEKMIKALSALFRYNLKTSEAEVTLAQEIKVAKDYMYLQQMRFGSRINCKIECQTDAEHINIPAFSFQPLIENAIIHGVSKKEEGGSIYIHIWERDDWIFITVADTGVGITEEKLEDIKQSLRQGADDKVGIGLGSIYKRIKAMYLEGEMKIFSKEGIGTAVKLKIPGVKRREQNV